MIGEGSDRISGLRIAGEPSHGGALRSLIVAGEAQAAVEMRDTSVLSGKPFVWCRQYEGNDRTWVFTALAFLPQLYPDGHKWLDKRLDDVRDGKAACTVVLLNRLRVGLLIETPKAAGTLKISTLWVDPRFRGLGAGRHLLGHAKQQWLRNGLTYVYVTTDLGRAPLVQPFLQAVGFRAGPISFGRYGEQRDELVLYWRPEY